MDDAPRILERIDAVCVEHVDTGAIERPKQPEPAERESRVVQNRGTLIAQLTLEECSPVQREPSQAIEIREHISRNRPSAGVVEQLGIANHAKLEVRLFFFERLVGVAMVGHGNDEDHGRSSPPASSAILHLGTKPIDLAVRLRSG